MLKTHTKELQGYCHLHDHKITSNLTPSYPFLTLLNPLYSFTVCDADIVMPLKSPTPKLSEATFVELLEKEQKTFDKRCRPLLTYQHQRLQLCLTLLHEGVTSASLSDAQRFGRSRARVFLIDIFNRLGAGSFPILCCGCKYHKAGKGRS